MASVFQARMALKILARNLTHVEWERHDDRVVCRVTFNDRKHWLSAMLGITKHQIPVCYQGMATIEQKEAHSISIIMDVAEMVDDPILCPLIPSENKGGKQ